VAVVPLDGAATTGRGRAEASGAAVGVHMAVGRDAEVRVDATVAAVIVGRAAAHLRSPTVGIGEAVIDGAAAAQARGVRVEGAIAHAVCIRRASLSASVQSARARGRASRGLRAMLTRHTARPAVEGRQTQTSGGIERTAGAAAGADATGAAATGTDATGAAATGTDATGAAAAGSTGAGSARRSAARPCGSVGGLNSLGVGPPCLTAAVHERDERADDENDWLLYGKVHGRDLRGQVTCIQSARR
jgi:hypothetical protein